jgi:uncharacterized repeat protein (TIGR03803 family)
MGGVRGARAAELRTLHTFGPGPRIAQEPLVQGTDGATYGTTFSGGPDHIGTVYKITATGEMVVLHSFMWSPNGGVNGGYPGAGLTLANDGNFYGTTVSGGRNGHGTIFRITSHGSLTTLHHFSSSQNDYQPSTLVQGNDGYLYGTTEGMGGDYAGIAFKISLAGAYTQLHRFSLGTYGGNGLDGGFPGPLMKAQDGSLCGLARTGGANGAGSLFRVNPGGGVSRIYSFADPYRGSGARLVELAPGEFYGTSGSTNELGIIYRVNHSGVFTVLYTIAGGAGTAFVNENLVAGSDGNLYGTCSSGPSADSGFVFRFSPSSGVFDILHTFTSGFPGGLDGRGPRGGLVRTGEQTFRGTTLEGGLYGSGTVFEITTQGAFTTLFNFSPRNDGAGGSGAMVEMEDGSLYGATSQGGSFGWGTIFRVTPEGELTTLYNFQGDKDRGLPGRLVLGPDGFFYGITHYFLDGYGTLFKVSRTGAFTTLRNFASDQEIVAGDLVLGNDGNFYATVWHGGASHNGAIARVTPAGEFTVIHEFVSATDGAEPFSSLVQDGNGFLYGVTNVRGADDNGTIFRCSPAGDFTVLHQFTPQEGRPATDPVLGSDGSIYGATFDGGAFYGGTVFRLAPNGAFTVLHDFEKQLGVFGTTLMMANDGNLYGASASGEKGQGYLFQVAPTGAFNVLYSFSGGSDGSNPGALMEASNGLLYGSTAGYGGAEGLGTLFSLSIRPSTALLNISTRMRVETGDNVLIGGFIVTGTAPKNVVIRGIGPSLSSVGISGALADPTLELRGPDGSLISANDNWQDYPLQAAQLTALGFGLPHSNEAGIIATLPPNAYTAVLAGKNSGTGVGLLEVYDIDQTANAQMANISTRGLVQTGTNVMIGGFILGGSTSDAHVIVRGIGPSLADLGLSPVLANPTLELHDGNGALLTSNDNWLDDSTQAAELSASGLAPTHWQESGIRALLPPGPFTAVLAGQNGGSGIGLIEIYNLH